MSSALQTCADRITAALEYLTHEKDRLRAISLAIVQLQHAQVSLVAGRGEAQSLGSITFSAAMAVERNPWPPIEAVEHQARLAADAHGRMVVAHVESLLENLP